VPAGRSEEIKGRKRNFGILNLEMDITKNIGEYKEVIQKTHFAIL
jgi:hypothetical protein